MHHVKFEHVLPFIHIALTYLHHIHLITDIQKCVIYFWCNVDVVVVSPLIRWHIGCHGDEQRWVLSGNLTTAHNICVKVEGARGNSQNVAIMLIVNSSVVIYNNSALTFSTLKDFCTNEDTKVLRPIQILYSFGAWIYFGRLLTSKVDPRAERVHVNP